MKRPIAGDAGALAMRTRLAGTPSHSPVKAMLYLFRAAAILVLATLRR